MPAKELKFFGETVLMPVSNIVNDDGTVWAPPTVSTELVNLGTLSTSGTLTADQATQIGTTTVGVTARASVNSVTRFYERVNISGTTATLVSADDDALHVLTVNLSTRAYTLSDVALGGSGPEIPTPTTSDNGKVLGVSNGAYALQEAGGGGGGGTKLYSHDIVVANSRAGSSTNLTVISTQASQYTSVANLTGTIVNVFGRVYVTTTAKTIINKGYGNSWCLIDNAGNITTNVSLSFMDNEIQSDTVTLL